MPIEHKQIDTKRVRRAVTGLADDRWASVKFADEDLPEIAVRVGLAGGRVAITGLIIGAFGESEIDARALRDIRLGEVLEEFLGNEDIFDVGIRETLIELTDVPDYELPEGRPSGGYTDEHYRWVAAQYRRAVVRDPHHPMSLLTEVIPGRSEATIRRWVQRARDKGFLGPVTPGRAGEGESE